MLLFPGRKALKNELGLPSQGAGCEQKIRVAVHIVIWTGESHGCWQQQPQQRRRVGVLKPGSVVGQEQQQVEWAVEQAGRAAGLAGQLVVAGYMTGYQVLKYIQLMTNI